MQLKIKQLPKRANNRAGPPYNVMTSDDEGGQFSIIKKMGANLPPATDGPPVLNNTQLNSYYKQYQNDSGNDLK